MLRMTIFRSKVTLAFLMLGAAAVPFSAAVSQASPKPPSTYTVKRGDTLFSIARQLLGDESRWQEIYKLNADILSSPNDLRPGQVLKLDGAAPAPRAEKPEPQPAAPVAKPAEQPKAPTREERQEMTLPTPQPLARPVVVEPAAQEPQQTDSLFARRRGLDARTALRTYREQPYRPLRRGEFFAAGYLTEEDALPFGQLLGSVTPQQIRNLSERATATLYTEVAVMAPAGGRYQPGDSLLVVQTFPGPEGYGDIVLPTGMIRVTGQNGEQSLATVVAVYGPIRNGQLTIPADKFVDGGTSRAQPVAQGIEGMVLGQREVRELKHPQDYLFIDKGRTDGVARGDIFEVRRTPSQREEAAATTNELMAVLQVIHVREHSATVKILNVVSPDIAPGTKVVQVAKLPN
ncbi:MAG: LysM peptidoglycan-binding domain-containing protein [Gemmatimonadales bacterium]